MKTAILLYNPRSGRGRIARNVERIDAIFRSCGYEVLPQVIDFDANPFDGHETIDLMVVAGGDGTVNFVVNAMKRKGLDIPLGVIPAGTANDFAGALGMSSELLEAARQIASGREERVDVGQVNDLWFVNIFSFGIFTTTSQRTPDSRKHRIGKLAYLIEGVKEFRTMHAVPLEIVADGEHVIYAAEASEIVKARLDYFAEIVKGALDGLAIPDYVPVWLTGEGIATMRGAKTFLADRLGRPVEVVAPRLPGFAKSGDSSKVSLLILAETLSKSSFGGYIKSVFNGGKK